MSKLDELLRASAGIATESMGRPATATMHRASPSHVGTPDRLQGVARSKAAAEIPVAKIGPDPDQPRKEFDAGELALLAESLRTRGQLQPIRVRWDEGRGLYVIVCGERRWRAAVPAGMTTMSCVIMDGPVTPGELLTIQVVENALREDLKPIEQAKAFRALMDLNGWSTHRVAEELAIDQSTVSKTVAMLALPDEVQAQVEQGKLAPSVAYEVGKLDGPAEQVEMARRVVAEDMSRAEVVRVVKGRANAKPKGRGATGKAKKVTDRVIRTTAGPRVTVEFKRGLTPELLRAALAEVMAVVDAELGGDRPEQAA